MKCAAPWRGRRESTTETDSGQAVGSQIFKEITRAAKLFARPSAEIGSIDFSFRAYFFFTAFFAPTG